MAPTGEYAQTVGVGEWKRFCPQLPGDVLGSRFRTFPVIWRNKSTRRSLRKFSSVVVVRGAIF